MHTLASARAWAADELKRAGVESYALASDLLLGFAIGRDRVYVLSHTEEALPPESWQHYRLRVLRHAKGEPLQYLTGEREFFGLDFRVTPAVLIPRPETEILVETAVRIARERIGPCVHFVDVGTGSGCIAVSLAHEMPASQGYATDISAAAIGIARFNAGRHKVSGRIQFIRADLLDCFGPKPVFDLILCNPPYVALDEYDTLAGSVKDYEPHLALFGGPDGLGIFRRLAPAALKHLKRGGFLLLEIGAGQLHSVQRLMQNEDLLFEDAIEDLQGIPRCLVLRRSADRGSDDG
jgi:release factor glutamine methyltransferase